MKIKSKQSHPLIRALDDVIAAAKTAKLSETAALLKMARLDLLMRLHGIRANELEALSFALVRGLEKPKAVCPRAIPRRKPRAKLN